MLRPRCAVALPDLGPDVGRLSLWSVMLLIMVLCCAQVSTEVTVAVFEIGPMKGFLFLVFYATDIDFMSRLRCPQR